MEGYAVDIKALEANVTARHIPSIFSAYRPDTQAIRRWKHAFSRSLFISRVDGAFYASFFYTASIEDMSIAGTLFHPSFAFSL